MLDPDRRIVICARTRSGTPGQGAWRTRVSVGRTESPAAVNATIRDFIAVPESVLNTDMAKAYVEPGKQFLAHPCVVTPLADFLPGFECGQPLVIEQDFFIKATQWRVTWRILWRNVWPLTQA